MDTTPEYTTTTVEVGGETLTWRSIEISRTGRWPRKSVPAGPSLGWASGGYDPARVAGREVGPSYYATRDLTIGPADAHGVAEVEFNGSALCGVMLAGTMADRLARRTVTVYASVDDLDAATRARYLADDVDTATLEFAIDHDSSPELSYLIAYRIRIGDPILWVSLGDLTASRATVRRVSTTRDDSAAYRWIDDGTPEPGQRIHRGQIHAWPRY